MYDNSAFSMDNTLSCLFLLYFQTFCHMKPLGWYLWLEIDSRSIIS